MSKKKTSKNCVVNKAKILMLKKEKNIDVTKAKKIFTSKLLLFFIKIFIFFIPQFGRNVFSPQRSKSDSQSQFAQIFRLQNFFVGRRNCPENWTKN